MTTLRIARTTASGPAFEAGRAIRRRVFVEEQSVPESLEWDGLDEDAEHFLAWRAGDGDAPDAAGAALGTARLRIVEGEAKAERVAVLRSARRAGVGAALMAALEDRARALGLRRMRLNAQVDALPFYEGLGYAATGPVFEEAGIDHRAMHKSLDPEPGR